MEWSKRVFGNIFQMGRLDDIDKKLDASYNPSLFFIVAKTLVGIPWNSYLGEGIVVLKGQKSLDTFVDRNTRFFHAYVQVKRKWSQIRALKNNDGVWMQDKGEFLKMAADFYCNLYFEETSDGNFNQSYFPYPFEDAFPLLSSHIFDDIKRSVSNEDIKEAIFSMGYLKALRLDGLHAMFFQS